MLESGPLRMKEGVLQVIPGSWDEYTTIVFGTSLWEILSGFRAHCAQSISHQELDIRIQALTNIYTS